MANSPHEALCREGVDETLPGLGAVGDGLFNERVDAGLGQSQPYFLVQAGGYGHDGHVDAGCNEFLNGREQVQLACDTVRIPEGVGDSHEVDAVEFAHHAGMVTAHHAQPDQANAKVCHQAPAWTSLLTAVTMRSRSP